MSDGQMTVIASRLGLGRTAGKVLPCGSIAVPGTAGIGAIEPSGRARIDRVLLPLKDPTEAWGNRAVAVRADLRFARPAMSVL